MSGAAVVRKTISRFGENELILAGKLYRERLSSEIGEAAYYKTLTRMCKSGELVKVAKGTYYQPQKSRFGVVPISEKEIVSAFTKNNTGTVVGYALYNSLNLTTQVTKNIEVFSSALDGVSKSIRNVVIHRVDVFYSEDIAEMIHAMEVLQHFGAIQDIDYPAFLRYTERIAAHYSDQTFEKVMQKVKYKRSTIAFLQEILKHYHVENQLHRYLSELSKYKYPRMEELYDELWKKRRNPC